MTPSKILQDINKIRRNCSSAAPFRAQTLFTDLTRGKSRVLTWGRDQIIQYLRAKVGAGVTGSSYTCARTTWSSDFLKCSIYPANQYGQLLVTITPYRSQQRNDFIAGQLT